MISRFLFFILFVSTQLSALESIFLIFGPPGVGKGTFSQFIQEHYGYSHLSIGDLVRKEIDLQTEIGKEAKEYLQNGKLLKESMIQALVLEHLTPFLQSKIPVAIDGFPRTEESVYFIHQLFQQYNLTEQVLLIGLYTDDATCEQRILSRSICENCARIYNSQSCPPKQANTCDFCFSSLKIRSNDNEVLVKKRLEEFHQVVEKAYHLAQTIFPFMEFNTTGSLEECLQNYAQFMTDACP